MRRFGFCLLWSLLAALIAVALWLSDAEAGDSCPPLSDEWDYPACDDGNPIDGYWWWGEVFVPGLIRNESQFLRLPPVMEGTAVWYSAEVMEATAEVRGLSLDGYVDGVAAMSCADIGISYWIDRGEGWEGPFLVVDCPQLDDVWAVIVNRREVVEVGWTTFERWGQGPWPVTVSRVPPEAAKHLMAMELWPWFLERVKFYPRQMEVTLDPRVLYRPPNSPMPTWRVDGVNWVEFSQPQAEDYEWPSESRFLR
jgi:hypothetical protein